VGFIYIRDIDKTIESCEKKPMDSHFWKSLMKVKDTFLELGHFNVKYGSQTRFWIDTWVGNKPLKDKFPALFNIVRRMQDSIATILSSPNLNISFRRNLVGRNLDNWCRILASLQHLNLCRREMFLFGFKVLGNLYRQVNVCCFN